MQEFYINKGATLPVLKMELIRDGRNDYNNKGLYSPFGEIIQRASVKFTMENAETGVLKISKADAFISPTEDTCEEEYYICYKWNARDTKECGKFMGRFIIELDQSDGGGTLIVPIQDELVIYVQ